MTAPINNKSKELNELIKAIGESRSKQEEDKIILREILSLKNKVKEKNPTPKRVLEMIISAIYVEMLGHDASFCYIHAVNITQSKSIPLKKIGYLACSIFLNENSEFLLLLVSTIQKDLQSKNEHEISMALGVLSKLLCNTIIFAVSDQILKLLTHETARIRKKAVMVMHRMNKISPSLVPKYQQKLRAALSDKDPSVIGACLNVVYEEVKANPAPYKDLVESFVLILRQIIDMKYPKEYLFHRIPAPWIMIKVLQIISLLCANDLQSSEKIYEILSEALKRADDTGTNIGTAITFQIVKTIATIYPNTTLLHSAARGINSFLSSENNNWKYMGIEALISLVQIDISYASQHQMIVIDCLESKDETLKRQTLELLFKMTNMKSVEVIVDKMITFMKGEGDVIFKKDLINKIMVLSERFAPNLEWFFMTMNTVFLFGGDFIEQRYLSNVLKLLIEGYKINSEFIGEYYVQTYLELNKKPNLPDVLIKASSWILGEIGSQHFSSDKKKTTEIVDSLLLLLKDTHQDSDTKCWILNALVKLNSVTNETKSQEIRGIIAYFVRSNQYDLSQRAIEYTYLKNYSLCLQQITDADTDTSLSFLNYYVENSLRLGQKPKDPNRKFDYLVESMNNPVSTKLNFEAYAPVVKQTTLPNQQQQTTLDDKATRENNNESLKVSGPKKWTNKGYEDPIESKAKETQRNEDNNIIGVSGNKTVIDHYRNNLRDQLERRNLEMGLGFKNVLREEVKSTVQEKQKKELANTLFAGVGLNTFITSRLSEPIEKVWGKDGYNKQTDEKKKNYYQVIDLLQMQQTAEVTFVKSDQKVTLQVYEENWDKLPYENVENFQSTKINTEQLFRNMIGQIGLEVVEAVNNEIISAGRTSLGDLILVYASYDQKGNMELKSKTRKQTDSEGFMKREKVKEENLRSIKVLNSYLDGLSQNRGVTEERIKFYIANKTNKKARNFFFFEVNLPPLKPEVPSDILSKHINLCVSSLMDGLKSTQIKANPLLKQALEAEGKKDEKSLEKFFEDYQYTMGPMSKESKFDFEKKMKLELEEGYINALYFSSVNEYRQSRLMQTVENELFYMDKPGVKPLLWSKLLLNEISYFRNISEIFSGLIDPRLIYLDPKLKQEQMKICKEQNDSDYIVFYSLPKKVIKGMLPINYEELDFEEVEKVTQTYKSMQEVFSDMESLNPQLFLYVTQEFSSEDIPGYLSIPYNFQVEELVEFYWGNRDKIIEDREKYESFLDRIDRLKKTLSKQINIKTIAYTLPKNNAEAEKLLLGMKRLNRIYSDEILRGREKHVRSSMLNESIKDVKFSNSDKIKDACLKSGTLTLPFNFKDEQLKDFFRSTGKDSV